tara:strand:+ start:1338 stop:1643 length:306 start_codon:yes stop_codon:yes gene_type:complete
MSEVDNIIENIFDDMDNISIAWKLMISINNIIEEADSIEIKKNKINQIMNEFMDKYRYMYLNSLTDFLSEEYIEQSIEDYIIEITIEMKKLHMNGHFNFFV